MALPFSSLQAIINAINAGQFDDFIFNKTFANAPSTVGNWMSGWTATGIPAAGGTDASGTQYANGSGGSGVSANAGGMGFALPAVSPLGRVAVEFGAGSNQGPDSIILADRLCAIGPITVTATGSQALTTLPALPRYTNGVGVEAWLEVTTAFTTTAGSFFLDSYTGSNNGAATNATSAALATASSSTIKVQNMIGPFPLLAPDVGVKAVASFNVSVAPAAGAVNLVLLKRLATLSMLPVVGVAGSTNLISQITSLPILPDGSTLMLMYQAGSTTAAAFEGHLLSAYT